MQDDPFIVTCTVAPLLLTAVAITISTGMEQHAGSFVLSVVRAIRQKSVKANRLTSLKVIPRLGAGSGIGRFQYLQRVWSGAAELVGIDGISATGCYGLN